MAHANISVFVPHEGCPNKCSFCNQNAITGKVTSDDVHNTVLKSNNKNAEIAFFGGSFTLIEREYMIDLLDAAQKEINNGNATGIRFSTRPDGINDEVLTLLKKYSVKTIELGAQSTNNYVLKENLRGHTFEDIVSASELIKKYGYDLGLQMMVGLYKSDREKDIKTAEDIINLKPECVRIYPTVVIKKTLLCHLYEKKLYKPLTVNEAADICAEILDMFLKNNINVIRLGLHEVEDFVAGPFHPAFGEIAESRLMLKKALELFGNKPKGNYNITVNKSFVSKMIGQHRTNIEILRNMGYNCKVYSGEVLKYSLKICEDV